MHLGRFPTDAHPGAPTPLRGLALPLWTRRGFLVGFGSAVLGLGTGYALWRSAVAAPAATAPERTTLEWALSLAHASDDELIDAAGDLERAAARYPSEVRLWPILARLLDTAMGSRRPGADAAAACAIRSLALVGKERRALDRAEDVLQRSEFVQAKDEIRILQESRTRRRTR